MSKMNIKAFQKLLLQPSGSDNLFRYFHYGLALVYLIAMLPLFFQIEVLIGANGLLPAKRLIATSLEINGWFFTVMRFPSLFVLYPSDFTLLFILLFGTTGAVMMLFKRTLFWGTLIAWISFISITTIGGDFLIIIIDLFLAEVGFLAIFSTYFIRYRNYVPNIVDYTFRLLNFRLWFCMGINKFYMPLDVWTNFTFFDYFFQAQPMPTPLAKVFHHTPAFLKYTAQLFLFIGEVIVPFMVFGGRYFRIISFLTFLLISILIQLNGNYGYFNVLSVIVALPILNNKDLIWRRVRDDSYQSVKPVGCKINIISGILLTHIAIQLAYCVCVFNPSPFSLQNQFNYFFTNKQFEDKFLNIIAEPIRWVGYWRVCNPYGVFKGIPKYHGELRFLGSIDSIEWKIYEFRYLPSGHTDYLGFYAPYYPRLDHLMFYETLSEGTYKHNPLDDITPTFKPWTCNFIYKLMENDLKLTRLLKKNPFENSESPKYIKVEAYQLYFSDNKDLNWEQKGVLFEKTYKSNTCNNSILSYEEAMRVVFKTP